MAFTASALISTGSIDSFMTIIKNCLTSSGWDFLEVNSASAQPVSGKTGRDFVVRGKGRAEDPTRFYLNIYNQTDNSGLKRVGAFAFAGVKNFDVPVAITQLSAAAGGGGNITASTSTPHNLTVGDLIIVGGNANATLNEGWGGADSQPSTAFRVENIFNTQSFGYLSQAPSGVGAGGNVLAVYNAGSTRALDNGNGINVAFSAITSSFTAFLYYDEYRICGIISQSANFQTFYWGETERSHIPADFRDRAFLSAGLNSGSVTASLNRSVDNLRVGQRIWFVHPSGTTAGSGSFERTRITSRPTSASFGCVLANSYPSGSFVGEDPLPIMIMGNLGTNAATETLSARDARFIFHIDALRDPLLPFSGAGTYFAFADTGITEGNVDPDGANYLQGRHVMTQRANNPSGIRGRIRGFVGFANGTQTGSQEIIRVGDSSSLSDYKNFPPSNVDASGFTLAIGPGAS